MAYGGLLARSLRPDRVPCVAAMTEFRLVRQFDGKTSTSESRAYRVETVALLTEQEAMQLMRDLGSPYQGQKYDDSPKPVRYVAPVGAEVKTRSGVYPSVPMVKQADGSWKPKYNYEGES